ncbi:MAG TPA: hypothetical protein VNB06_17200 [Thermoanaerobaculia bacterium]|nr:hypothetical protein [Thermoanaerobaculia bacterium]
MATTKSTSKGTSKKQEPAFALPKGLPTGLAKFQKNILERQHSAFETAFQTVSSFQDGSDNAVQSFLEASPFVPAELRQVAEAWIDARRERRDTFKKTVDRSFELVGDYYDRLAQGRAEAAQGA